MLYLLLLFVLPFYVILSVAFGKLDPIFQSPVLVWNPLRWDTSILSFTVSNITHTDGIYHAAFIRTFLYVAISMVLCLLIGYPFAYFLARHAGRAKGLFLALFFAPFWFSYMLRMLAWIGLLQDQGYVNRILQDVGLIGVPYPFLAGKSWVLILGLVYGYVPYMVLPLYAGLDRIPNSQLEGARDLGASPARTFFRVTLPQTRQAILAGLIIAGLPMFGDYFTQQLLANTVGTKMIGNFIVDSLDVPIFVPRGASLILVLIALLVVPIMYYLRSTARAARARPA
jgi:ABC-type spermidine/putrescine transport system permease subunit I